MTEENLKVRDNLLYDEKEVWSNVYLVLLTQNSVVTCECRREDLHIERNKVCKCDGPTSKKRLRPVGGQ